MKDNDNNKTDASERGNSDIAVSKSSEIDNVILL